MMKNILFIAALIIAVTSIGCEVQSDITKKSLEKFLPTPSPEKTAFKEEPIDPSEIITADTATEGPQIFISRATDKKKITCDKYNRVMVNGNGHTVVISGACSRIMVNGDSNNVTAAAAAEIVTNGSGNTVEYSKFVNGKKPIITDNSGQNTIEKAVKTDTDAPKE